MNTCQQISYEQIWISIITGVISSFIFYLIFEFIPQRRQGKLVIGLIEQAYFNTKLSILFEFAPMFYHTLLPMNLKLKILRRLVW
jgi:hypothetical protein